MCTKRCSGIVFLSADKVTNTTQHLNEMNKEKNLPWNLNFHMEEPQQPSLNKWLGKDDNIEKAQEALFYEVNLTQKQL